MSIFGDPKETIYIFKGIDKMTGKKNMSIVRQKSDGERWLIKHAGVIFGDYTPILPAPTYLMEEYALIGGARDGTRVVEVKRDIFGNEYHSSDNPSEVDEINRLRQELLILKRDNNKMSKTLYMLSGKSTMRELILDTAKDIGNAKNYAQGFDPSRQSGGLGGFGRPSFGGFGEPL